jgi:Xaa-Pro aminopeptidase
LRDGAAVTRFLAWFDARGAGRTLTEIDAVEALEELPPRHRPAQGRLVPDHLRRRAERRHRALPRHARHQPQDFAGRAVPDRFRRAVRGRHHRHHPHHRGRRRRPRRCATASPACSRATSRSRAVFPEGTSGAQLDAFARRPLWEAGLDFDHGTGHGVGSYLSVHEGPQRISKLGTVPLEPGMILSNEPGYYKTGAYGIRIENLVLVVEGPAASGGEKPLNAFETLTLAPIDRRLIDPALLTPARSPGSTPTTRVSNHVAAPILRAATTRSSG